MKTQAIGTSGLVSSRIICGVMRIGRAWQAAGKTEADQQAAATDLVLRAVDLGINHFDTADIYGSGRSDELLGAALKARPGLRQKVIVTTKCCIRRLGEPKLGSGEWYDMSGQYVRDSVDAALQRLGTDYIDIFLMHRPDLLVEPAELAAAFDDVFAAGKVRHFGVSNFFPNQVSLLAASLSRPLVANQVPLHPLDVDRFYDGTMEQCQLERITPTAYSPVAGGAFGTGGKVGEAHPRPVEAGQVIEIFDAMAEKYAVTRTQITLAWLLRHPAGICPIIGTTRPERVAESVGADAVEISREDWHRLTNAARCYAGYVPMTGSKHTRK